MSYQGKTDPNDVNVADIEVRPKQTNAAGHTLDATYCAICSDAPCNKEAEYWGVCPACHASPQWLNIGASHWCYCPQHQLKWVVGANLFSSWMHETKDEQKAEFDALNFGRYTVVDDVPRPHSDYTPEQRAADQTRSAQSIDELDSIVDSDRAHLDPVDPYPTLEGSEKGER